jgi:hypothetical protein
MLQSCLQLTRECVCVQRCSTAPRSWRPASASRCAASCRPSCRRGSSAVNAPSSEVAEGGFGGAGGGGWAAAVMTGGAQDQKTGAGAWSIVCHGAHGVIINQVNT